MVRIIYGDYSQEADLAGKSVAEVRELYQSEFSIPDRARAVLNDQQLKRKVEPETRLEDEDELSFEARSRKPLVAVGAFLLVLAITGGLYAYTALTDTTTIDATAIQSDAANVTANTTGTAAMAYTFLGRIRGTIPAGTLFNISQHTDYTGDVEVLAQLANPDELSQNYTFWMLRFKLVESDNSTQVDVGTKTRVMSLDSPVVSFPVTGKYGTEFYLRCIGGSYRVRHHALGDFGDYDPLIFCEVIQAGAHP